MSAWYLDSELSTCMLMFVQREGTQTGMFSVPNNLRMYIMFVLIEHFLPLIQYLLKFTESRYSI